MSHRIWFLLALFAAGISWLYATRIQGPWRYHQDVEIGRLRAELGDLYSPWTGTRELLLHRRNPYSAEVTHEIQIAFYGHIISENHQQEPVPLNEQRFAYPVYVALFLVPTVYLSFSAAQLWVVVILSILTAIGVILWLGTLGWRFTLTKAAIVLFVLSSPPLMHGLRFRQLGLLVAFLLAVATWCTARQALVCAGVTLALATIKPQMSLLPLVWFLVWGLSDWRKRWQLLASFAATLGGLIAAGEMLLPHWIPYFWKTTIAYRKYTIQESLLSIALGRKLGLVVGITLCGAVLVLVWSLRTRTPNSQEFLLALAMLLTTSVVCLPLLPLFNQVLLILPVFLILGSWNHVGRVFRFCIATLLAWPWLTAAVLLLVSRQLSFRAPLLPSYPGLMLPFIVLAVLVHMRLSTYFNPFEPAAH